MKIFKIIYYLFLVFIAAIALLLIVSIFPIAGNYKIMVVQSSSMAPSLKMGGVVLTKPVAEYKIGDIISFKNINDPKKPITHRIYDIEVNGGKVFYITKGDANNAPDQRTVSPNEVIGKVLFDIPYLGYAVEVARKPLGFILILIIPALLIISDEVKKIIREIKKIKEKKKSSPC